MPTHSGPNTLGESNLVFAYDLGDVSNSYKGEPTTNLANTDTARTMFKHDAASVMTFSDAPEKGEGWKKVVITERSANNFRYAQFPYISNPGGTQRTYSVEYDMGSITGYRWRVDGSGGYSNIGVTGTGRFQFTITPGVTGVYALFLTNGSSATGINDTIYYRYYQVENNAHATPFTSGSRSATQGLLDLTGTSTIDLSNVSFDSNAQMVFDGTDDYIQIGQSSQFNITTDVSAFAMVKINDLSGWDGIFGTFDGSGFIHFQLYLGGLNCYVYGPDVGYDRIDSAQCYLTPNQWTEVGFTFGANTLTLYINGVAMPTKVYGSANSVSSTSAVSIGRVYAADRCFGGNISDVRLYNRALTQAEISQNYLLKNLRERN
jgi:hypothetical protein